MNIAKKACVYCCQAVATTRDHVPPAGIFAKPRPQCLATVPACATCNHEAAQDDEYFRTVLTLKRESFWHPDVQSNLPSVLRAFTKPAKLGFARSFFRDIRLFQLLTPSGLYVGSRWGFGVDWPRVERVLARVVRGLYFVKMGSTLPLGTRIITLPRDALDEQVSRRLVRLLAHVLMRAEWHVLGRDTFTFMFGRSENDPRLSVWLFEFYRSFACACFTLPHLERPCIKQP